MLVRWAERPISEADNSQLSTANVPDAVPSRRSTMNPEGRLLAVFAWLPTAKVRLSQTEGV